MSEEDPMVDGQPLSSLRVVDLREALEKHGLSKSGNKKELADRLREFLVNGTMETSPTKSLSSMGSPTKSPENSLVAAYKARQAAALNKASEERERVRRESETEPKKETPKKGIPAVDVPAPAKNDESEDKNYSCDVGGGDNNSNQVVDSFSSHQEEQSQPKETNINTDSTVQESTLPETSQEKGDKLNAADKAKEKSKSPTPEKKEIQADLVKAVEEIAPNENDNDDHVELDYGEGDGDGDDEANEDKGEKEEAKTNDKLDSSAVRVSAKHRIEAPKTDDSPKAEKINGKERNVSPSRYPACEILHIRGLMRPFTIPLLKNEICKEGGEIVDFWIDNIRSHCFVKMKSTEESTKARNALHGSHWPTSNPKMLAVQFDTQENMDRHKSGEAPSPMPVSASRTISTESHDKSTSERRDRPTLAPLGGRNGLKVTLETMVRDNNKKEEEERERREKEGKEKAKEIEKKIKEREVKEKEERENRKRQRSETPPHSRIEAKKERRASPERKERIRDYVEVKKEEKVEPEKPVKTADEYFKKTVAQPAIYYLPLSEDEAVARVAKRERERR